MNKLTINLLAVTAALAPAPVLAQTTPSMLRLVTESLDGKPAAQACGLSTGGVNAAIRSAMRYNRIPETVEVGKPVVYTNVNPITLNNGCAAAYRIEIKRYQFAQLLGVVKPLFGDAVFCSSGGIMSGPRYDLGERIAVGLKTSFDACLSQIAEEAAKN